MSYTAQKLLLGSNWVYPVCVLHHGVDTQTLNAKKLLLGWSWVYPVGVQHHYIFIVSQLWLTSYPRSTVVLLYTKTPGTSSEIYSEDAEGEIRTRNQWYYKPSALAIELYWSKVIARRSWAYPVGVLHHYIFPISQLSLTSHQRSTVVLLDIETHGTSRETYNDDAEGATRTRNDWIINPILEPLSYTAQKILLGRSWVYPVTVLHQYTFIISQLW